VAPTSRRERSAERSGKLEDRVVAVSREITFRGREYSLTRVSYWEYAVHYEDERAGRVALGFFSLAEDEEGNLRPYAARFSGGKIWADTKFMLSLARHAIEASVVPIDEATWSKAPH
jgi:hypothetical protein